MSRPFGIGRVLNDSGSMSQEGTETMPYYTVQIYQDDHENGIPCQKWSNVASEFDEVEARKSFDQFKQKIGQGVHIVEIGSDEAGLIERVGGYPA